MNGELELTKKTGVFCYICGKRNKLTFHHLKDLNKKGRKHYSIIRINLVRLGIIVNSTDNCLGMPLCRTCHDLVEEAKVYVKEMKRLKKAYNLGFKQGMDYAILNKNEKNGKYSKISKGEK